MSAYHVAECGINSGSSAAHAAPTSRSHAIARSPRRRPARWFFGIVLALGIGCILYPVVTNIAYQLGAYNAVSTYDAAVARYSPEELERLWAEAYAYNDELASPEVRDPFAYDEVVAPLDRYYHVLDPDGTGMMGYVEVPSVGLELPIYHGTAEETLEKGAGHLATTALPVDGTSLHPVITGHTGLPDKLLFTNLALVKEGDLFRVRILDRTFTYRVASIDVIEPDDTSLLQPVAGENRLTLLTCTPYGINSHRLFVTGVPTTEDDVAASAPSSVLPWIAVTAAAVVAVAVLTAAVLLTRRHARRRV